MRISVVMPSFNQAKFVEAAIRSIIAQNASDVEVIFVDGGSTDGTMQIVDRYRSRIAVCISERDNGQSDALRKGFSRASGDVLTWLNTDDLLLPGALRDVQHLFALGSTAQVVFGNTIWINAHDQILKCHKSGDNFAPSWAPRMGILTAGGPSAFFTRDIYEKVGGVNPALHYMMDTELWWRFAMHGARMKRSSRYLWALRLHEDAKVSGHLFAHPDDPKQERIALAKDAERQHIQKITGDYVWRMPSHAARLLRAMHRAASAGYYQGLWHNMCWHMKDLSAATGSLCPKK